MISVHVQNAIHVYVTMHNKNIGCGCGVVVVHDCNTRAGGIMVGGIHTCLLN